ncbi:hypothetical protein [Falsibacillus albus]|uniref:DUF3052 domain-containing protein n=1 Tax=Falsibacillus albus TaxID=2478915 RepID=A0A3L7JUD4_9BACI|nr:hypothetical protein [Falsibacillus albus]RLQ94346.1 hypothetical protein D9X91_14940 [Falsibacillus albus]
MEMLVKKLRYKSGEAVVLNAPEGYQLGIESKETNHKVDFLQLFVKNSNELSEWLPKVLPMLNEDALFWISFPKKSSKMETDLNRDILAAKMQEETIFRPVSNVAVDETWSALRFRDKEKVKSKK